MPQIDVSAESVVGESWPGVLPGDIDLENEAFNRRYRVRTFHPKYAHDLLVPRTIEALLSIEPFSWRIEGRDIVAWGPPSTDPEVVLARLDVLAAIAANIPQFVWEDIGRPG